jgi:hypothetical protein
VTSEKKNPLCRFTLSEALPYDHESKAFRMRDDEYQSAMANMRFVNWLKLVVAEAEEAQISLASYNRLLQSGVASSNTRSWAEHGDFLAVLNWLHNKDHAVGASLDEQGPGRPGGLESSSTSPALGARPADIVSWWTLSDTPDNAYVQFQNNQCRRTLDAACEAFKHLVGPLRKFHIKAVITVEDEGPFECPNDVVLHSCYGCGMDAHSSEENNLVRLKKLTDEGWVFELASGKLYCRDCYARRPKA